MSDDLFKKLIAHTKEYGFIFPSSEIYDGLSAVYDYGPFGVELKKNIRDYWWKAMVQMNENIVGIDSAIFMHPETWKASGHLEKFNDPLIDNKDSKRRYRADVLIEDHIAKIQGKIDKEIQKAKKRFGEAFDQYQFETTSQRLIKYKEQIKDTEAKFKAALDDNDLSAIKQLIIDLDITDPETGSRNWTDVRQFNLMFATELGAVAGESQKIYLRPETAQGIFVNFLNVQQSARMKIPFGIAQAGKSFRNEIIARQFIFRTREFEQMEMQFFVRPGEEMEWYRYWKNQRIKWHKALEIPEEALRFHDHLKPAHYASAATDIEYNFPFGMKEVEGIHSRTDYDLGRHSEFSGKKLQYFDPELQRSYTPFVVETAIGLDRMVLAILSNSYLDEKLENNTERTLLKLPPALAPIKVAVLPLVKKDGLPEIGRKIFNELKYYFQCFYEEKDTIGKRYRRMDAIGTPYCITIDQQTKEDETVTVRYRDSMEQKRIKVKALLDEMRDLVSLESLLKKLEG